MSFNPSKRSDEYLNRALANYKRQKKLQRLREEEDRQYDTQPLEPEHIAEEVGPDE